MSTQIKITKAANGYIVRILQTASISPLKEPYGQNNVYVFQSFEKAAIFIRSLMEDK